MNYYNEFDPKAAAWLRELIKMKMIPEGVVDERSICDVVPAELMGYEQCHFFAGIGGWSRALDLAGFKGKIWTGSCPCQAFSTAGKQLGFGDPRDLWPVFFRLIRECRPSIVLGEQVEAAIRHGWLDRLQGDLEGEGYAVGSAVLGAHSVGAPHIRQRLYWGARISDAELWRRKPQPYGRCSELFGEMASKAESFQPAGACGSSSHGRMGRMDDPAMPRLESERSGEPREPERWECLSRMGCKNDSRLADASRSGSERSERNGKTGAEGEPERHLVECGGDDCGMEHAGLLGSQVDELEADGNLESSQADWRSAVPVWCRDGVYRLVPHPESGIFPLAYGIPRGMVHGGDPLDPQYANQTQEGRNVRLKGYGNAIVPQVAAEFIRAFL